MKTKTYLTVVLFCALAANAQLTVTVASSKVSGQKALVPLAMKNSLTETVQSARAVVFILDDQGKVTGQATRWVIGGPKAPDGLSPGATNSFQFVVTSNKLIPPNATAKVTFNRVVLQSGKLADVNKDVQVFASDKNAPAK